MKPADNVERVTLWVRSKVMVSFPQSHAHFCVALSLRERFGHSTGLNLAGYALDPCKASSVARSDQGLKSMCRSHRVSPSLSGVWRGLLATSTGCTVPAEPSDFCLLIPSASGQLLLVVCTALSTMGLRHF